MRTRMLSLFGLLLLVAATVNAQGKTEEFKVNGNCGMCETRIEKAAKSVEGVSTADWSQATKMLKVSYDESKTDASKIQLAIANVGHDTPMHRADDKVYDKLPGCCKFDRASAKDKKKDCH